MRWSVDWFDAKTDIETYMKDKNAILDQANLPPDRKKQVVEAFQSIIHDHPELMESYDVSIEYTGHEVRIWSVPRRKASNRTRRPSEGGRIPF